MSVEVIRSAALSGTVHGFLGRRGGCAGERITGLNVGLGSGEDPAVIAENRSRAVAAVLPGAALVTVHQIHSALAVEASAPWPDTARPHADAIVTNRPGLLLGVLTADCAPVLLVDRQAAIVGAAHAGWRGAIGGVTDATIAAMEKLGAVRGRIAAAIGPCIARTSYEVDGAFLARFLADDPANECFFTRPGDGKPHFDLASYLAVRLGAAGIATVEPVALDTYTDPDRFFSYRRSVHRGEKTYGRQVSLIGIAR